MAGSKRPSFLKRQKEQKRLERAAAKRQARQARRDAKSAGAVEPDVVETGAEGTEAGQEER